MSTLRNKRILVTGGAGSIGSELVRQLVPNNKVFILDSDETGMFDSVEEYKQAGYWCHGRVGDIRDEKTVEDVFSDFKPQIVFHAAALKHVTPGEWYPREYVNTNIIGTLNLIQYAKKWECLEKFVFVSTDKAVQSSSIMGATKRVSEIIVRNQGKGFVVVRFGNVLGSRGSVIPLWQKAIQEGKSIKVTSPDMTRYMMTIDEAVSLVIEASQMGKGGEIICLQMGKKVNILDLAKRLVKEAQTDTPIEIIGLRPGEQLTEKLLFEEEEHVAKQVGKFIVIS
ncbi:MAG: polysaccharide biosynthesis protein [Nitrospira sp.]